MIENLMSLYEEDQNYNLETLPYLFGMKHHLKKTTGRSISCIARKPPNCTQHHPPKTDTRSIVNLKKKLIINIMYSVNRNKNV